MTYLGCICEFNIPTSIVTKITILSYLSVFLVKKYLLGKRKEEGLKRK
jgi:hypothetical protein